MSKNSNEQSNTMQSLGKKNLNKKNHLFHQVIVEDEAEDLRGSQLGNEMAFQSSNIPTYGQTMGKTNHQTLGKKGSSGFTGENHLVSMNRDSNSPTP